MAGGSITSRISNWMGNRPVGFVSRAALPPALLTLADLYMNYGVIRGSLAFSIPAGVTIGFLVARNFARGARIRSLEQTMDHLTKDEVAAEAPVLSEKRAVGEVDIEESEAFNIVQSIGAGTQAKVYLVSGINYRVPRVLKLASMTDAVKEGFNLDEFESRFIKEAEKLKRLSHPNIVRVNQHGRIAISEYNRLTGESLRPEDIGGRQRIAYMLMEYIKGDTVRDKLNELKKMGVKGFPVDYAAGLFLPLVCALMATKEADIIHRDIKPENIIITTSGVKLYDFGVAKDLIGAGTRMDAVMGTLGYMAPEQMFMEVRLRQAEMLGQQKPFQISWKSDQFAAGCNFFEWLTGETPFKGAKERDILKFGIVEKEKVAAEAPEIMDKLDQFFENAGAAVLKFKHGVRDKIIRSIVNEGQRNFLLRMLQQPHYSVPNIKQKLMEKNDPLTADLNRMAANADVNTRNLIEALASLQESILTTLQKIFGKTLNIDPDKRYDDYEELKKDIISVIEEYQTYKDGIEGLV